MFVMQVLHSVILSYSRFVVSL